jgi:hypothetical protein
MVSRLKHENVVELLGYCADGTLRVLAYEFATMGSLHDILHGIVLCNIFLIYWESFEFSRFKIFLKKNQCLKIVEYVSLQEEKVLKELNLVLFYHGRNV